MKKTNILWTILFTCLLGAVFLFILVYVWISMTTDLAGYAIYAGTMQAYEDYGNGELYLYHKTEDNTSVKIDDEIFKFKKYSIHYLDISGRYGMQNYVNAYNSKMKQLYEKNKEVDS